MASQSLLKKEPLSKELQEDASNSSGILPFVSALLKETRLKRGENTGEIAARLRISERYLVAIEENDFEILPEQVYVLGFVGSYARYLDLSSSQIVKQYKEENYPPVNPPVLSFPESAPSSTTPKLQLVLAAGFAAALVCGAWYFLYSPRGADMEAPAEPPGIAEGEPQVSVMEIPEAPPTVTVEEQAPALQEETAPAVPEEPLTYDALEFVPGQKFSIKADALSWLEVQNAHGQVLTNRNLKAGESVELEAQPGMTISTGNAGGLRFVLEGRATELLGKQGEILRNQQLRFKAQ